jgi:hypothetical protein
MIAGLADIGNEAARKLKIPGATDARMGQAVASARNFIGGREGTGAGPATGFLQGLSTLPMGGGFVPSIVQGAGLGSGLATPQESVLSEGGKGGLVAGGASIAGSMLGRAIPKSSAEQRLKDIAAREGIPMRYGTQSNTPMIKEMEARAERSAVLGLGRSNLAFKQREAIENKMAQAIWRKVGMEFDEFTPSNFTAASKAIGEKLQQPFKNGDIPFGGMMLQMSVDDAVRLTDDMTRPEFVMKAAILLDKKMAKGKLSPSELNVIMDDLRGLANSAYDDNNKAAGDAISNMLKTVKTQVIAQIPTQTGKESYKKALTEWANLKVVEDAFVKSGESSRGNLDFSKLKMAIERSMPGGYTYGRASLSDLAELGQAMKGKAALPEGIKFFTADPIAYTAFNNPLSAYLRDKNPISQPVAAGLMKAAGVQAGTE